MEFQSKVSLSFFDTIELIKIYSRKMQAKRLLKTQPTDINPNF